MKKWTFSLRRQNSILLSNTEYTIKTPEAMHSGAFYYIYDAVKILKTIEAANKTIFAPIINDFKISY